MEVERTFWEKATILHAEHYRPANQSIRERFARHYADLAALWEHPARAAALARLDLLERVVKHKSRFFASSWANYEAAKPGGSTFRDSGGDNYGGEGRCHVLQKVSQVGHGFV